MWEFSYDIDQMHKDLERMTLDEIMKVLEDMLHASLVMYDMSRIWETVGAEDESEKHMEMSKTTYDMLLILAEYATGYSGVTVLFDHPLHPRE